MQYAQAITILRKMQAAAPPTAAARIGAVIDLMIDLFDQNAALRTHAEPVPQASIDPLFQQTVDLLLPALTSLRGQIRALRSGNLGRFNSEQESALHLAEQQADSAFDMIDSLFTLMKVESGVVEIHSEAFDGEATINRAWNWVKERAEARGHRVAMRIDDPLPKVLGDPIQVLTILVDLMENAVLYTPPGGTIRMTADTLGTHVLFGIEDTGIGLSPEDRVGEPFWRGVEHPLVRQHPGGGLRLYLASELLRMMGGELFFSGEQGEGSTFSFTLPTAKYAQIYDSPFNVQADRPPAGVLLDRRTTEIPHGKALDRACAVADPRTPAISLNAHSVSERPPCAIDQCQFTSNLLCATITYD